MRLAIVSDIHGNAPALDAVLAHVDDTGVDAIYSLGDVAGYYCFINEVIERLREREIESVMGNHDWYLLTTARCRRSRAATACLQHQAATIRPENREWLRTRPIMVELPPILMVHGGLHNPIDEYLSNETPDYFDDLSCDFLFSGHTHVQGSVRFPSGKGYLNPGSVGQPRDGNPHAAWALFDDGEITLKRVPYDIEQVEHGMRNAGFDPYFYENLRQGTRIGGTADSWNY